MVKESYVLNSTNYVPNVVNYVPNINPIKVVVDYDSEDSLTVFISTMFGDTVELPYDYKFNSGLDIAIDYLIKQGFELTGKFSIDDDSYYIISPTIKLLENNKVNDIIDKF